MGIDQARAWPPQWRDGGAALTDEMGLAESVRAVRLWVKGEMMQDSDIEISARYATYERIMEYLLATHIAGKNPDEWDAIQSAIIGPGSKISKGLASVDDLERMDALITERIADIFGRASEWVARGRG